MIVYFDTSALVKAYVSEKSSLLVKSTIRKADAVSSHTVAFVEAHAAFSRLKREKKINEDEHASLKDSFVSDWENYLQIDSSKALLHQAVELADAFALRAYDSIHLSAALMLMRHSRESVLFACFDQHMNKAAKILGFALL